MLVVESAVAARADAGDAHRYAQRREQQHRCRPAAGRVVQGDEHERARGGEKVADAPRHARHLRGAGAVRRAQVRWWKWRSITLGTSTFGSEMAAPRSSVSANRAADPARGAARYLGAHRAEQPRHRKELTRHAG
ncbi:hypothetical protein ACFVEN_31320 [Streptomyces sp. NPDC057681]|uniref:hypothetical protein n=1 Tax=Streptomyces sp. NPDC057681 TaxID=3346209 RepID=UPI00369218A9